MIFKLGSAHRVGAQLRHIDIRLSSAAHSRRGACHPNDERGVHSARHTEAAAEQEPRVDGQTARDLHHGHLRCVYADHRVWYRVCVQVHAQE